MERQIAMRIPAHMDHWSGSSCDQRPCGSRFGVRLFPRGLSLAFHGVEELLRGALAARPERLALSTR